MTDAPKMLSADDVRAMLTEEDAREMLRKACAEAGSPSAWATKHHLSRQYISQMLDGSDHIGWKIARAIGLKRIHMFVLDNGDGHA